jgi:uncharacterized protein YqhQ
MSANRQDERAVSVDQVLLGGQAVIEGVMMRGPHCIATAVRRRDGAIILHHEEFVPLSRRSSFWKLPLFRGIAGFFEMTVIGIRMLNFSAAVAMDEEHSGDNGSEGTGLQRGGARGWGLALTVAISLALAVGLFFVVPLVLTTSLFDVSQNPVTFNLTAGVIRLSLFLGYLSLIARIPDVGRLFMYHGAEHKTVFAYERERTVSVQAAQRQSRFHPRCGTSFLLVVVVASIVLFALVDAAILYFAGAITLPLRLLWHLLLLPLVAGGSYEAIRFSASHADTVLGRAIMLPGLLLQRLTTREPSEDQLQVAVAALQSALGELTEGGTGAMTGETPHVELLRDDEH